MAWTPPGTQPVGAVLTAAYWNVHVRDNLKALAPGLLSPLLPGTAQLTPTANTAYFARVEVLGSFTVASIEWALITSSGNLNLGIYNSAYARQWRLSATSIAAPSAGAISTLISAGSPTSLTLQTGTYWVAIAVDNVTARILAYAHAQTYKPAGLLKSEASQLAMGDPATPVDSTGDFSVPQLLLSA